MKCQPPGSPTLGGTAMNGGLLEPPKQAGFSTVKRPWIAQALKGRPDVTHSGSPSKPSRPTRGVRMISI